MNLIGIDLNGMFLMRQCLRFCILTVMSVAVLNGRLHAQDDTLPVRVTAENYETWRAHILPKESDFAWQKIGWLTSFKDGIIVGDREEKPVLLWTMNGHPLGCT